MRDYYSILRKAVAEPHRRTDAERDAIYAHARRTIVRQLRAADPPWTDADIDREIETLDAAVARLESEMAGEGGRPAPPDLVAREDAALARAHRPTDGDAAPPPRRVARTALFAAAAALLLIGAGGLWLVSRDRASAPTSAGPADPLRPTVAGSQRAGAPATDAPHASYLLRRQHVYYRTTHPPGTVMISRNQRFLYIVQPNQAAIRYAIGVGPDCVEVAGLFRVTDKVNRLRPGETQARQLAAGRKPDEEARLGSRIVYFGDGHAVHETTEPARVGQSASFGCFHQWEQDITDLYDRVPLNERVVVAN